MRKADNNETVEARLLNSDATRSLISEREVATSLARNKWSVSHSSFYPDPVTGKLREIDVVGMQFWRRKDDLLARFHLLVECKSASGYNLVFSEVPRPRLGHSLEDFWFGRDNDALNEKITATLERAGLKSEEIGGIMKKFERMTYRRHRSVVSTLLLKAPNAEWTTTAFRETNIGGEKDLDNSVVWRAMQTLFSCIESLRARSVEVDLDNVYFDTTVARRLNVDPVANALDALAGNVRIVDLYHPVVVIDSPLWGVRGKDLVRLKWCRLEQRSIFAGESKWVDVVNSKSFDEFMKTTNQHYRAAFHRRRIKQDLPKWFEPGVS